MTRRWVVWGSLAWMAATLAACSGGDDDNGGPGTQCCALRAFCGTCATCDSSESTIGQGSDEVACQQINEHFMDVGRYCHMNNAPPQHTITEFIAQCTN